MATGGEMPKRASIFEIVGAWLGIWTPPRDVRIPPVPWRKLAIGGGVGVLVIAGALAVMVPRIDSGKEKRAAADAAFRARARTANRNRVNAEQRPLHGAAAALRPTAGAGAAEVAAARAQLVTRVEASILADARARASAGEMRKVAGPTTCKPTVGTKTGGRIGVFDCFTVSRAIPATKRTAPGQIGYPFRAVVDFGSFTYAWCKVEQMPGELMIPDPSAVVALPTACRVPQQVKG
jgi:hypothetical protein